MKHSPIRTFSQILLALLETKLVKARKRLWHHLRAPLVLQTYSFSKDTINSIFLERLKHWIAKYFRWFLYWSDLKLIRHFTILNDLYCSSDNHIRLEKFGAQNDSMCYLKLNWRSFTRNKYDFRKCKQHYENILLFSKK